MIVSEQSIKELATCIKELLDKEIVVINKDCIITYSSNKNLKKHSDEIIKMIVNSGREIYIDKSFGVEKMIGAYFPLREEGELLFIIGILGENENIKKQVGIIQRVFNILLTDIRTQNDKIKIRSQRIGVINKLITLEKIDDNLIKDFKEEAIDCNIYLDRIKYIAIGGYNELSFQNFKQVEKMLDHVTRRIEDKVDGIVVVYGLTIVCLIYNEKLNFEEILGEIGKSINEEYNVKMFFGISEQNIDQLKLIEYYKQAKQSLEIAKITNQVNYVKIYDVFEIKQLFLQIESKNRDKYMKRLFKNNDEEYIHTTLSLLKKYYKCNGSINKMADELYIHKNTLQYKLNLIKSQLGYDPRKFEDAFLFQLAIQFYDI